MFEAMSDILAAVRSHLTSAFKALVAFASRMTPARLAWGGLALAAVTLLSVNLIASETLSGWKADLTQDRLFTISPGSVAVLKAMDEPVKARVYFSKALGEAAPSYARYFDRLRTLLEEFSRISGGKLELEFLDPEPFSDAEDRAVAAGLRGRTLNADGEQGYFGLAATNSTDDEQVVPFFSPDRESFVEYDLTKLFHTLSNPKKPVVGVISALPLDGGQNPMTQQPTQPWIVMQQIREFFDVQNVPETAAVIPPGIDVLLIAQPTGLTPEAAYAIDQYALKGGKLLILIDPMSEMAHLELLQKPGNGRAELAKLLKSWGVDFDATKVAADIQHARRVQFGRSEDQVTDYVAWLALDRSSIDQRDVLSNGIETLNLASAGILNTVPGATTTVTPILTTSTDAMAIETKSVGMTADPIALLRSYQPGGKALTLAARISGEAKTAFPNGKPKAEEPKDAAKPDEKAAMDAKPADQKPEEAKAADAQPSESKPSDAKPSDTKAADSKPGVAEGRINAIVIADTDIMADQLWVDSRQMMGQDYVIPSAHNGAFIVSALENLTGSDALIALRGRGIKDRTFTLVESLRRDAERKYREKEQALTDKLKSVQAQLEKLQANASASGNVIVSDEERNAIENFKSEMLETRRELRQVKLALRQSIDSLDGWLQFANIALVPLLILIVGVGWTWWRNRSNSKTSI
jgi:ABC-type uncharacterized transport system involved in gliding motility auxiliary subunit